MIYNQMFGAPIEQFTFSPEQLDRYNILWNSQTNEAWIRALDGDMELKIGDWIVDLGKDGFGVIRDEESKELIQKARKEEPMHVTFKTTSNRQDAGRNE